MDKLRENIEAVHRQLEADLAAGDPKAKAFASMLGGELKRARDSLGLAPLQDVGDIWIGAAFHEPENGVLILGESTYGSDLPLSLYVPQWCRGEVKDQTFSRIFNAFSGLDNSTSTTAQREAFWSTVAFANFVEASVGETRDCRPTSNHYGVAATALPSLLKRIGPRGVLILGKGQAGFSEPVVAGFGKPYVVCPHPTGYGVRTSSLQSCWEELQIKMKF